MDDIVKAALAKWPHVPHCYGWLGLDARGQWHMRDERSQAAGSFASGILGMTSTAPMSRELASRLSDRGLSRLIEIYGSSATGGIGWRSDSEAHYALLPCWRRQANGIARADGVERPLPDVVEWAGERLLKPLRREDDAVQVAGVNVYPSRVAEAIRRLPIVVDCIVRKANRYENARLEAFVVCRERSFDREAMAREVAAFCGKELSAPERPVRIEVGTSLPLDAMGKPTAW